MKLPSTLPTLFALVFVTGALGSTSMSNGTELAILHQTGGKAEATSNSSGGRAVGNFMRPDTGHNNGFEFQEYDKREPHKTPVPEPSPFAAVGIGGMLILLLRRR